MCSVYLDAKYLNLLFNIQYVNFQPETFRVYLKFTMINFDRNVKLTYTEKKQHKNTNIPKRDWKSNGKYLKLFEESRFSYVFYYIISSTKNIFLVFTLQFQDKFSKWTINSLSRSETWVNMQIINYRKVSSQLLITNNQ